MGCPDSEGDYDVIMPEPMDGTMSGYKVMVTDVSDEMDADCSDEFTLMASTDAPDVGDEEGPFLMVTSPAEGDVAMAGEEYTVEWDYDNGVGSAVDRFAIDLYMSGGTGDCGTFYMTICDKPSIGCKDSRESTWAMSPAFPKYPLGALFFFNGTFDIVSVFFFQFPILLTSAYPTPTC